MEHSHELYDMLYSQTPTIVRWVLGVLTLGLFTLAGAMWKRTQNRVGMLEEDCVRKREIDDLKETVNKIDSSVQAIYKHLIK